MKGLSSDSKLKGWILRLRGLPFNATDEDVVRPSLGLPLHQPQFHTSSRQLYYDVLHLVA